MTDSISVVTRRCNPKLVGFTLGLLILVLGLNSRLFATVDNSQFDWAVSPYVGYHIFEESRNLAPSVELGVKLAKSLGEGFFVDAYLGTIPTVEDQINTPTHDMLLFSYGASLGYNMTDQLFVNVSYGADSDSNMGIQFGIGYRFFKSSDSATNVTVRAGESFVNAIEFQRYLSLEPAVSKHQISKLKEETKKSSSTKPLSIRNSIRKQQKIFSNDTKPKSFTRTVSEFKTKEKPVLKQFSTYKSTPLKQSKNKTKHQTSRSKLIVDLLVPDAITLYQPKQKTFVDINSHWGKTDIETVVKHGIMGGFGQAFRPKRGLSKYNALKVLVYANTRLSSLSETNFDIKFGFLGDNTRIYKVSLLLENSDGYLLKTLVQNKTLEPGKYDISLDIPNSVRSNDTLYARLRVSNGIESSERRLPITVKSSSTLTPDFEKSAADPILHQAAMLGLIPAHQIIHKKRFKTPISKRDFILYTSRLIATLNDMPLSIFNKNGWSANNFYSLYQKTLGYSSDYVSSIHPKKSLTRAEAAVIISRVLKWQQSDLVSSKYQHL